VLAGPPPDARRVPAMSTFETLVIVAIVYAVVFVAHHLAKA
jgi:hypothetical protein